MKIIEDFKHEFACIYVCKYYYSYMLIIRYVLAGSCSN